MKTLFFKDLNIGQYFWFGEEIYCKTSKDRALGFGGGRTFNLMEIVSL
jgi:hypothetical protein